MKMVMAIVPKKFGDDLLASLNNAGYAATFVESRGGMLRQSQISVFIGVKEAEVPNVLTLVENTCSSCGRVHYGHGISAMFGLDDEPVQTQPVHDGSRMSSRSGAVVFVWSLDRFELP